MVSAGSAEVEVHIPSGDYIRRNQFESYYCTADIYPGKIFPLELIGITPKANASQLYSMRFRLAGGEGELPGPGIFFFQAEDGIRDFHVTGVQTCALPI